MATLRCPHCSAPMKTLSTRTVGQNIEITIQTTCDCAKGAQVDLIHPQERAKRESTPAPQHRTQRF